MIKEKEYEQFQLPNGIQVVHKEINHTKISHLAIMLDMGSRDEVLQEQGLVHFLEHMAFKGTKKRSNIQIINELESLGGELNAYTTKEKICFYVSILSEHIEKAVDVLTDIVFNSIYPDLQLEKEKKVVLEELAMNEDNLDELIQDNFETQLFPNHSLGRNILGSRQTITHFSSESLHNFFEKNLNTEKTVFSCVGNISTRKMQKLVDKYLKIIPQKKQSFIRSPIKNYEPTEKIEKKHTNQSHFIMGLPSLALTNVNRIPFFF